MRAAGIATESWQLRRRALERLFFDEPWVTHSPPRAQTPVERENHTATGSVLNLPHSSDLARDARNGCGNRGPSVGSGGIAGVIRFCI